MVILAESKREPSFAFVPVTDIEDPFFPWLYETLRQEESDSGALLAGALPPLRWVHLYYNRQFLGLYLQVSLPGRHFADLRLQAEGVAGETNRVAPGEGAPGEGSQKEAPAEAERLETLIVAGDRLVCADRKLRPICPIYNLAVADGVFPQPVRRPETDLLSWLLAARAPRRSFTFILSDRRYEELEVFPLPFDPSAWLGGEPYQDRRYLQWQGTVAPEKNHMHKLQQRVRPHVEELDPLAADLKSSIRASCRMTSCASEALIERLEASPSRRWALGEEVGG